MIQINDRLWVRAENIREVSIDRTAIHAISVDVTFMDGRTVTHKIIHGAPGNERAEQEAQRAALLLVAKIEGDKA